MSALTPDEELRFRCLDLAVSKANEHGDAHKIVEVADIYYAFVTDSVDDKTADAIPDAVAAAADTAIRTSLEALELMLARLLAIFERADRGGSLAIVTDDESPLRTTTENPRG